MYPFVILRVDYCHFGIIHLHPAHMKNDEDTFCKNIYINTFLQLGDLKIFRIFYHNYFYTLALSVDLSFSCFMFIEYVSSSTSFDAVPVLR